jgi:Na+/H+ antiporter NhaC
MCTGICAYGISDKAKISREKLSYIADSGAAPVSVLVPITGWAAYLSGLAIGVGAIVTQEDAMGLFIRAIPYNFYAVFTIAFVGLIAGGIIKDFGPMKKAESRAMNEGKVLRDGAIPLIGRELTEMESFPGLKPRVFLNFLLPVIMIITIAMGTYLTLKSAKTMEAFLFVLIFMGISMFFQGVPFKEIMDTATNGIKGAVPAVIILGLAYSINTLSKSIGTANYIISLTEDFLSPQLLPAIIFIIAGIVAFSTGSSWGTFAITMPIALPLAFAFTGGEVAPLVMASFAAVAGGGVFGDHCSPLSDTTILASTGAAADHIDHVKTQLPYALICGGVALTAYLIIGFVSM